MISQAELRLLRAAADATGPASAERLCRLAGAIDDWPRFTRRARQQGMLGYLARGLRGAAGGAGGSGVPPDALRTIEREASAAALYTFALSAELAALVRALRSRRIEPVSLKGPALALEAHGDLALRPCRDLDLLVRDDEVAIACEVLGARGYRGWQGGPLSPTPATRCESNHWPLVGPDGFGIVEVHWATAPPAYLVRQDPGAIRSRAALVHVGGTPVRVPSPRDAMLLLCLHGTRHLWDRLAWVCDVAQLARRHVSDLDWDGVLDDALHLHARRALLVGLLLARRIFRAPVPAALEAAALESATVRRLANAARRRWRQATPGFPGMVEARSYWFRTLEGPDRARFVWQVLCVPGPRDRALLPVPPAVGRYVHPMVRPVRLAARYALHFTRGLAERATSRRARRDHMG